MSDKRRRAAYLTDIKTKGETIMSLRYDRIGEEIRKGISDIIREELKDPRIAEITTILSADATSDLTLCKVHVSVYDKDDAVRRGTVEALNHASGFIARELRKRIEIRRVPKLLFVLDDSIAYSVYISKIINDISAADKKSEETEDNDE